MNRVLFNITPKDIREGMPRETASCPIARSILRKIRDKNIILEVGPSNKFAYEWKVFLYKYSEYGEALIGELTLPARIRDIAIAFDSGKDIKPTNFSLDVPEGLL